MRERSELGKLVSVRTAAAWASLIGSGAGITMLIYGIVRGFSGDPGIGVGLMVLGCLIQMLSTVCFVAVRNRLEGRSWALAKRYPNPFKGTSVDDSILARQADGSANNSAGVETRRAKHLALRLAVLARAEELRTAAPVDRHAASGENDANVESLQAQLVSAIANVRGQIELQKRTPGSYYTGMSVVTGRQIAIRELQLELAQLEEALAGLKSVDPEASAVQSGPLS